MNNSKKYVAIEADAQNWKEAIKFCGEALIANNCIGQGFVTACIEREKSFPTGLPTVIPVAIPHAASDEVNITSVCILKLKNPVEFKRMDDSSESIRARLVFNLAIKGHNEHLDYLQNLIAFVMDEEKVKKCLSLSLGEIPNYLENNMS